MFSHCSDTILQKFVPYTLHSFNFKYWILNTYSEWPLEFAKNKFKKKNLSIIFAPNPVFKVTKKNFV